MTILEFYRKGVYQHCFNYMHVCPSDAQLQRDILILLSAESTGTKVCIINS